MRDLHINCASGDCEQLRFIFDTAGVCPGQPVFLIIRNKYGESVLWLTKDQVKRLAERLNEAVANKVVLEPEII